MCMDFSFGERPSVHVSVYGILDPSTQWEFESMCMEFSNRERLPDRVKLQSEECLKIWGNAKESLLA